MSNKRNFSDLDFEEKLNDFYENFEEFKKITEKIIKKTRLIEKSITVVPRAITFAGTIGSGKTTCTKIFEKFLKDNGYKVKRMIEVSMQIPNALNLFYETKNGLFFQQVITDKYKQVIDEINELEDYHYILIDRGFKEIEIFTDLIIKDKKSKEYLKKQRDLIAFKLQNDIIFVNPTKKTAIERKKARNRLWEKCDEEYLSELYDKYEEYIPKIYQKYTVFNNDAYICKDCCELKECNDENCNIRKYYNFFSIFLKQYE
ncbi:P-loop containing nucleoside triphosphate hydrolase protein [Gigaspora rosea]|uniref:P-loop containing nucleoside triphosphate hydrolase protein n=1 Tax=Gigaspora rosea TaxID=44941 RepID=A0A397TSW2_9GLOM|nr:P-loop containing nucleoside triphosphate hydrolase protein [Gigaspora rosea]